MDHTRLTELINRSKQNDQSAFRPIVEYFQGMIYGLCFRMLNNEEEAKDAVQETFLRAWTRLARFDSQRAFQPWLYALASHLCLDVLRARKRRSTVPLDLVVPPFLSGDNTERNVEEQDLKALILALTDGLTPKQKLVFVLRDLEELEVDEVTQITGMSPGKIKSNLFLARQTMRNKLNQLNIHEP